MNEKGKNKHEFGCDELVDFLLVFIEQIDQWILQINELIIIGGETIIATEDFIGHEVGKSRENVLFCIQILRMFGDQSNKLLRCKD